MSRSELDRKAKEVLEAVWANDGKASTTDVKEYTGIEKNQIVHYRYQKLEDKGLIETEKVERDGTLPVTVATLTEKGHQNVEAVIETDKPPLTEQLDELREAFGQLQEEVYGEVGQVDELTDKMDRVEARINSLEGVEKKVDDLNRVVDTLAYLVATESHALTDRRQVYGIAEYAESKTNDYRESLAVTPTDMSDDWLRKGETHVPDHWDSMGGEQ